jgi:hypothetical protein
MLAMEVLVRDDALRQVHGDVPDPDAATTLRGELAGHP